MHTLGKRARILVFPRYGVNCFAVPARYGSSLNVLATSLRHQPHKNRANTTHYLSLPHECHIINRKTKRAEAVIKELKTVIARVLNSNSGSSSTTRQRGGGEFSSAARGKPKRPRSERGNCEPDLGHRTIGDQKYEEQEQWEQAVDERENTPGWRAEAGSVDARGCHNREPSISRSEEEATVPTAPTSVDVWGMLDTYVSRRSDVARANCHVKAIEAMRKVGVYCESGQRASMEFGGFDEVIFSRIL